MKIACGPMKRNGGSITNISSVAALHGPPNMIAYTASKWGVRGISRTAAIEFAPHRIRVNTIFPGMIMTSQALNAYSAERLTARTSRIPVGRAGEPNDIANLAAFLCSDAGSYCNGAEFTADGGETTLNAAGMSGMKG